MRNLTWWLSGWPELTEEKSISYVCVILSSSIFKVAYIFLRLIFLLRGFFLLLIQWYLSRFKEFSLECLVIGSSLIRKKEYWLKLLAVIRYHLMYHSWSLVMIRCHSLAFVVPFIAIRCYSLSSIVTPFTTRLSFNERLNVFNGCTLIQLNKYVVYEKK